MPNRLSLAGIPAALGFLLIALLASSCNQKPEAPDRSTNDVAVRVGDDLQALIDENPPGTTYRLLPGTHRLQSAVPHDGDRFIGEQGAVLSGAAILEPSGFVAEDGKYVIGGQVQQLDPRNPVMIEGRSREARPEELFVAGRRFRHVQRLEDVNRSGTWWFDYDADQIWVYDDPATMGVIETSISSFAFGGSRVQDVVIQDLEVRNYASPAQGGAIDGTNTIDWIVDSVVALDSHATGIRVGPGMRVSRCRASGNGQLGVGGSGRTSDGPLVQGSIQVSSCELLGNHTLGYDWTWEAGGAKFTHVRGGVFANNVVEGHAGPAVWFDIDSRGVVLCANRIVDNLMGIFVEISADFQIYGNEVAENTRGGGYEAHSAFYVSESTNVSIRRNLAWGQVTGVRGRQIEREDSDLRIRGLEVLDNDLAFTEWTGLTILDADVQAYAPQMQRFAGNTYRTDASVPFQWKDGLVDFRTWQGYGHDLDGVMTSAASAPGPFPSGVDRYTPITTDSGPDNPEPVAASCASRPPP